MWNESYVQICILQIEIKVHVVKISFEQGGTEIHVESVKYWTYFSYSNSENNVAFV